MTPTPASPLTEAQVEEFRQDILGMVGSQLPPLRLVIQRIARAAYQAGVEAEMERAAMYCQDAAQKAFQKADLMRPEGPAYAINRNIGHALRDAAAVIREGEPG